MHRTTAPFLACLLSAATSAQVALGDIAATGFSTTSFGVISAGPVVSGYTTPGFQGTGTATSQAILWDPAHPNDFLVGGFGFVGRATITGPGTVSYTLITNGVGIVSQMSWDRSGGVVVADSGNDQIRRAPGCRRKASPGWSRSGCAIYSRTPSTSNCWHCSNGTDARSTAPR